MNTPRHDHDEIHYAISNAGVALYLDLRCLHGDAAVDIEFHGTPCKPNALPDSINTLIPRCGFTHIVGSILAQIGHHEGEAAAERFLAKVREAETLARHELQQP